MEILEHEGKQNSLKTSEDPAGGGVGVVVSVSSPHTHIHTHPPPRNSIKHLKYNFGSNKSSIIKFLLQIISNLEL